VWSWSRPKKLHRRKETIRLFRRFFTPLLKKNYSSPIKMSTRINDYHLLCCILKQNLKMQRKKLIQGLKVYAIQRRKPMSRCGEAVSYNSVDVVMKVKYILG
jgi:hypothetical protein